MAVPHNSMSMKLISGCDLLDAFLEETFTEFIPGCHAGGGNIVQRNAGLSTEELKKNNVASSSQIYDLIYNGKGKMPGYGQGCTPKVSFEGCEISKLA